MDGSFLSLYLSNEININFCKKLCSKNLLSFPKHCIAAFIVQNIKSITKQREPFSCVLWTPAQRDYESPNLIVCILFIWLCCCSRASSRVGVRQVLKKNKESVFIQLRGWAPLKSSQRCDSVLVTTVERGEAQSWKSNSIKPTVSKLTLSCLSLVAWASTWL